MRQLASQTSLQFHLMIFGLTTFWATSAHAQKLELAPLKEVHGITEVAIGVTRAGTPIPALITQADLDIHAEKMRVLIVAGLDGSPHTTNAAINVMKRFHTAAEFEPLRKHLALSILPCGNPDGLAKGILNDNGVGGNPSRGYPPSGEFYTSDKTPESQYLWRWIGMHAPDMVIEFIDGKAKGKVDFLTQPVADGLAKQLQLLPACDVGTIPTMTMSIPIGNSTPFEEFAKEMLAELKRTPITKADEQVDFSAARRELQARDKRSTREVCDQLARVYGHELATLAYIPAVACIGRLRLAAISKDGEIAKDLERLTADYLSGTKPTLNAKSGGSEFAGHILWGELFDATQNRKYVELTVAAANRAFDENGKPLEAMPTHSEMSDAVFMGCPILAQAGRLTGDRKYLDMCMKHMRFMLKLNLRDDGLHRHSPLDEAAWGRGNGFPALGLALSLEDIPSDYNDRAEMLAAFQKHLTALLPHQDPTGMWHQVIDHPESYRELTATCMITYAMTRGVRRGWLPKEQFAPAILKSWKAIKLRITGDGALVDVCTGTGKQKSLRDYFERPAILGRDPRGGAMALLVATEILTWEIESH